MSEPGAADRRAGQGAAAGPAGKPLLRALAGQAVYPPPVWLMRQAGRYLPEYRAVRARAGSFLDLCFNPELAAEVTLQPVRRFATDGAILFADILVVPHALGQEVRFETGEGPRLASLRSSAALARLRPEDALARLAPVAETVARLRAALPPEVALIGFAGAPWTVATYMVEGGTSRSFAEIRRRALGEDPALGRLIELLVAVTADYLAAQVAAGAEVVQLFDSWAGVLPAEAVERWIIGPTREVVGRLKARHPTVPVIGFPRGLGPAYPAYVRASGVDAVGVDSSLAPAWVAEHLQPLAPVQGNLDPAYLVVGGRAMERAARAV